MNFSIKRLFFVLILGVIFFPSYVFGAVLLKLDTSGNPPTTEYSIYEPKRDMYVQSNGALGKDPVWKTYEGWGGDNGFDVFVEFDEAFSFQVKARNVSKDETDFSEPVDVVNVRGPKDVPPDFITLKLGTNVVSPLIFQQNEEDNEPMVAGFWTKFIDHGLNAFLMALSLFVIYYLVKVLQKQPKKQFAYAQQSLVSRLRAVIMVLMVFFVGKLMFTAVVMNTYATWSAPVDRLFTSDASVGRTGDIVTYQVLLSNNDAKRENVEVINVIPEGTTYIAGSLAIENTLLTDQKDSDQGYYDQSSDTVYFVIPSLDENQKVRLFFSVKIQ